jgi:hypothetical protein
MWAPTRPTGCNPARRTASRTHGATRSGRAPPAGRESATLPHHRAAVGGRAVGLCHAPRSRPRPSECQRARARRSLRREGRAAPRGARSRRRVGRATSNDPLPDVNYKDPLTTVTLPHRPRSQDRRRVEDQDGLRKPLRDDECANERRVDLERAGAKPSVVTEMIEVPPNEHVGRGRLRLARRHEPDSPKVLEKLQQRCARVGMAALATSTRQECSDVRLVELGDRDPRVSHPSNERADRSPLVRLSCCVFTASPAFASVARNSGS